MVFFLDDITNASSLEKYLLDRIPEERLGKIKIFICFVGLSPTVRKQENIKVIPTVKLYEEGRPKSSSEQFLSHSNIMSFIKKLNSELIGQ